jgi:hypothetical protein
MITPTKGAPMAIVRAGTVDLLQKSKIKSF